jgi:hypothetical protein
MAGSHSCWSVSRAAAAAAACSARVVLLLFLLQDAYPMHHYSLPLKHRISTVTAVTAAALSSSSTGQSRPRSCGYLSSEGNTILLFQNGSTDTVDKSSVELLSLLLFNQIGLWNQDQRYLKLIRISCSELEHAARRRCRDDVTPQTRCEHGQVQDCQYRMQHHSLILITSKADIYESPQ